MLDPRLSAGALFNNAICPSLFPGMLRRALEEPIRLVRPAWFVLSGVTLTIIREKDGVYKDGVERNESPETALASMNVGLTC